MSDAARQPDEKVHQIRWDGAEWQRIEEVAEILTLRDHVDLNPTDIIRKGTRQLLDEVLAQQTAKAS